MRTRGIASYAQAFRRFVQGLAVRQQQGQRGFHPRQPEQSSHQFLRRMRGIGFRIAQEYGSCRALPAFGPASQRDRAHQDAELGTTGRSRDRHGLHHAGAIVFGGAGDGAADHALQLAAFISGVHAQGFADRADAVLFVEDAARFLVHVDQLPARPEGDHAKQQTIHRAGKQLIFAFEHVESCMQLDRALEVRQQHADQSLVFRVELRRVAGAGHAKAAFDAVARVDIRTQQMTDIERLQVFLIHRALEPLRADQFLGGDDFAFRQPHERVEREEVGFVGPHALRGGAAGVDHHTGFFGGRWPQNQRDMGGAEAFPQQCDGAVPGRGFGGAVVDGADQFVEVDEILGIEDFQSSHRLRPTVDLPRLGKRCNCRGH